VVGVDKNSLSVNISMPFQFQVISANSGETCGKMVS